FLPRGKGRQAGASLQTPYSFSIVNRKWNTKIIHPFHLWRIAMSSEQQRVSSYLFRLSQMHNQASLQQRLMPKYDALPAQVPFSAKVSVEDTAARWQVLPNCEKSQQILADAQTLEQVASFQGNIE